MFQRRLHANDGSESAFKALQTALNLGKRYQISPGHGVRGGIATLSDDDDEMVEEREEADQRFQQAIERAQALAKMQHVQLYARVVVGELTHRW